MFSKIYYFSTRVIW